MTHSHKIFKGTLVLTTGRTTGYALAFARNLILARALAKADYGLAAVFSMAMVLLEVVGRMAFGQQVIQSRHGDSPEFQGSAHALQFIGGVIGGILIASLSIPMASLFGVPHIWWAFASLAVVPVSQGLSHLDVSRRQRQLEYLPLVLVDVVPQMLTVAVAWPLAVWLGDYRAIVWLMIGKAIASAVMTYVFAHRSYRWAWNTVHIRSMMIFGWPLLINGLVMFFSQQADQVLVGKVFSLDTLANYSLAFSLVSTSWYIFSQVGSGLMLPLMSRMQDDLIGFRRQYGLCVQGSAIGGTLLTLPLIISGEQVISFLYGAKYQGAGRFVALLGVACALRFLRFAPAIASIARGDTISQLHANLWRGISFPLAIGMVALGGDGMQIATCAIVAELISTAFSMQQLWKRQGIPLQDNYRAAFYTIVLSLLGLCWVVFGFANTSFFTNISMAIALTVIAVCAAWVVFPEIAIYFTEVIRKKFGVRAQKLT